MLYKIAESLHKLGSKMEVSAHCDIPCKIYDPAPAIITALTVVRMPDLMHELEKNKSDSLDYYNTLSRYIREKEDQATLCKEEIRIIWGDYFKAPQIEKFPEIHQVTHEIMMAASKTKQGTNRENALKLVSEVNKFAEIFWKTKNVATKTAPCPYPPNLEVVYPTL